MNEYRNKKTGAVIISSSEIKGGDWEKVSPKKSTTKKKSELKK